MRMSRNSRKPLAPPPPPTSRASCHQCKTTKKPEQCVNPVVAQLPHTRLCARRLMFCTKVLDSAGRQCHKKYCGVCMMRTYGEHMKSMKPEAIAEWSCPFCRSASRACYSFAQASVSPADLCSCTRCRRQCAHDGGPAAMDDQTPGLPAVNPFALEPTPQPSPMPATRKSTIEVGYMCLPSATST